MAHSAGPLCAKIARGKTITGTTAVVKARRQLHGSGHWRG